MASRFIPKIQPVPKTGPGVPAFPLYTPAKEFLLEVNFFLTTI
jgi:hypothetical protein